MVAKIAGELDLHQVLKLCTPKFNAYPYYLSLAFGLYFLYRDKTRFWKITNLYLFLVVLTQIIARYSAKIYHTNIAVFNVYIIIEISYITYAFYVFLSQYIKIKNWLIGIYIGTMITYAVFVYLYDLNVYNTFTISLASVIFVIYGLMYFYLLLKDENYIDLRNHPAFWWVGGTLIFYFGSTLANFFDDLVQHVYLGKLNARIIIYTTLNFFLYAFWAYSFVCRARQRKLSH
ncbi:hypothetical protein G7074_11265 [Pedobacter sp. HDW13]|uniref:hypothetical protein n=1 Tax=unclassified Pedobacter TaxID=2628915 RepID=UPI000F598A4B|nr:MULTISPECIES: hypothetical protein [unclassified Pedobacter]QIL39796.1 hypothetical protein G7074_11265 [Pedobacter sp. HDW13]RQO79722.1 hypothetical protein DBR40_01840 [Pedobacter sp. KBW01]